MSNINRPVVWSAKPGIVVAETVGRRGKVLLTVKMNDGREIKIDAQNAEFADVERFAPPQPIDFRMPKGGFYGDTRHLFDR